MPPRSCSTSPVPRERAAEATTELLAEWQRLLDQPLSEEELSLAIAKFRGASAAGRQTCGQIADRQAMVLGHGLGWSYADEALERAGSLDPDSLHVVARQLLSRPSLSLCGPPQALRAAGKVWWRSPLRPPLGSAGAELSDIQKEGAAPEAHRQLVDGPQGHHLAGFIAIDQIGRAQHRHRIGGFEVGDPGRDPHPVAHVERRGFGLTGRTGRLIRWWMVRRVSRGLGGVIGGLIGGLIATAVQLASTTAGWGQPITLRLRALANWSGALVGLLLIIMGGLIQAAVPLPLAGGGLRLLDLPVTAQVPALLLTALVCGPRPALLAAVAYLSLGLLVLPVFHSGGGMAYLLDPGLRLPGWIRAGGLGEWTAGPSGGDG